MVSFKLYSFHIRTPLEKQLKHLLNLLNEYDEKSTKTTAQSSSSSSFNRKTFPKKTSIPELPKPMLQHRKQSLFPRKNKRNAEKYLL